MFKSIDIKNFGPISSFNMENPGMINLIIGRNDTGKSFLLKILYLLTKSVEECGRGDSIESLKDVINRKLRWTFQVDRLSELVTRPNRGKLEVSALLDEQRVSFAFTDNATKSIGEVSEGVSNREFNSIFIPAKEVLSIFDVIKTSRNRDYVFGFDDTYYDLVLALENSPTKGRNYELLSKSRKLLEKLLNGKVDYVDNRWHFKRGNLKFSINTTAEGIRKVAILDRLIGNRYLTPGSLLFIDEPESVLHPKAIIDFLEIVKLLADNKIQVFLATHSYFVIKKLYLQARQSGMDIPVVMLEDGGEIRVDNLQEGIPDNQIVDTSIELYEEELEFNL